MSTATLEPRQSAPVIPADISARHPELIGGLCSPEEAAAFMRRSRAFVYAEMSSGRLRSVPIGRRGRRIRWSDLIRYVGGDHATADATTANPG